jgi:hypothetical protein
MPAGAGMTDRSAVSVRAGPVQPASSRGFGADRFDSPEVFDFSSWDFGNDTIAGFDATRDVIQLNHALAGDFATVQADMSPVVGGTLITFDVFHLLTLSDVAPAGLSGVNFRFV